MDTQSNQSAGARVAIIVAQLALEERLSPRNREAPSLPERDWSGRQQHGTLPYHCHGFSCLWLANCCFAHDFLGFPSCYDSAMRNLVILFIPFIATLARLLGPGGARSIVAESLLLKHQLLIVNRSRQRSPKSFAKLKKHFSAHQKGILPLSMPTTRAKIWDMLRLRSEERRVGKGCGY